MFKILLLVSAFALTANCFDMGESERLLRQYFSTPLGSSSSSSGGLSSSGGSPAAAGDSTTAATTVAGPPPCDAVCATAPSDTAPPAADLAKCPTGEKICFKVDGTTPHDPGCTGPACTPAAAGGAPAPATPASSTSSGGTLSFYPLFQVSSGGINGTGF